MRPDDTGGVKDDGYLTGAESAPRQVDLPAPLILALDGRSSALGGRQVGLARRTGDGEGHAPLAHDAGVVVLGAHAHAVLALAPLVRADVGDEVAVRVRARGEDLVAARRVPDDEGALAGQEPRGLDAYAHALGRTAGGSAVRRDVDAHLAAELLAESLPAWLAGAVTAQPQSEDGASLTHPLHRADGRLDPSIPARQLERQVRAYQPWPGSWTEWHGVRLIVWRASAVESEPGTAAAPGELVTAADGLVLATSVGGLRLDEIQPAGGRRMSAAEYLRGRRD